MDRRNIGALFVEEIGIGGMFKQIDLQESECYLLDAGAHVVYLWQGLESSYQGRALSTRVCRRYCAELRKDHDICAAPRFRSIFQLPVEGAVEISYVESGEEPSEFCQLFPKWVSKTHSSTRLCPEFHPNEITSDESLDEKFDKSGRSLGSLPVRKGRYSDGTLHSRHQSQPQQPQAQPQSLQQPETSSTKNQSESLFKITLRSHERHPPTHTEGGTQQTPEQVPEFVAKRNALRAVKCPDPILREPMELTASSLVPSPPEPLETEQPVRSSGQEPKKSGGEISHRSSTSATTVLSTDIGSEVETSNRTTLREEGISAVPNSSEALEAPVGGTTACCRVM